MSVNPETLVYLASATILSLGVVISTALGRRCRHQWEPKGESQRWDIPCRTESGRELYRSQEYRQTVACKKCGKHTWFKVAG